MPCSVPMLCAFSPKPQNSSMQATSVRLSSALPMPTTVCPCCTMPPLSASCDANSHTSTPCKLKSTVSTPSSPTSKRPFANLQANLPLSALRSSILPTRFRSARLSPISTRLCVLIPTASRLSWEKPSSCSSSATTKRLKSSLRKSQSSLPRISSRFSFWVCSSTALATIRVL